MSERFPGPSPGRGVGALELLLPSNSKLFLSSFSRISMSLAFRLLYFVYCFFLLLALHVDGVLA